MQLLQKGTKLGVSYLPSYPSKHNEGSKTKPSKTNLGDMALAVLASHQQTTLLVHWALAGFLPCRPFHGLRSCNFCTGPHVGFNV